MYKLIKKLGDRTVAKYYLTKDLAEKRATGNWSLYSHDGDMEYSARSINKGEVKKPKYEIEIPEIEAKFGVPTEGLANQIVELLSTNYKDVRARALELPKEVPVEEDSGSDL